MFLVNNSFTITLVPYVYLMDRTDFLTHLLALWFPLDFGTGSFSLLERAFLTVKVFNIKDVNLLWRISYEIN